MNEKEAIEQIASYVSVTRQNVVLAKSFILSNFSSSPKTVLKRLLEHFQIAKLDKFILHESIPSEPQVKQVAKIFSWQMAFAEALWGLIGSGLIIPTRIDLIDVEARQDWTTIVGRGGGYSSAWHFEEYDVALPASVRLAPSLSSNTPQPLSDGDLFLSELGIPDIHPEVENTLRQAVECFRHELYLPSLAMLGMASEGAWIELGLSLLKVAPDNPGLSQERRNKLQETLQSSYTSVLQKMEQVSDLYKRQDIYKEVAKRSGFNHRSLGQVLNWSNVIRDARNAIHYGADPASENTYEKVAALLLGTGPNLRVLYAIRRAAAELNQLHSDVAGA